MLLISTDNSVDTENKRWRLSQQGETIVTYNMDTSDKQLNRALVAGVSLVCALGTYVIGMMNWNSPARGEYGNELTLSAIFLFILSAGFILLAAAALFWYFWNKREAERQYRSKTQQSNDDAVVLDFNQG